MLHSFGNTESPGHNAGHYPLGDLGAQETGQGFQTSVRIKGYPAPLGVDEVLTEGEVRRRVDQAIERAVAKRDGKFITGIVLFAETAKLISGTSAKFTFEDPARLATFAAWLREHYVDVTRDMTLQVHCSTGTSAVAVIAAGRTFAQALNIHPDQLQPTHYGSELENPRTPTAMLTVQGRGICGVLSRMSQHLRQLAEIYGSKQPDLANKPKGLILARFLTSLLNGCEWDSAPAQKPGRAAPSSGGGATATQPEPSTDHGREPDQGTVHPGVDPALVPKLIRRIQLLLAAADQEEQATEEVIQAELRRLAKKGDALGVAASACVLWQLRASLPQSKHLMDFQTGDERSGEASTGAASTRRGGEPQASTTVPTGGAAATPVYLTVQEFAALIRYDVRTLRERLLRSVFVKGIHYTQRPGGRKILIDRDKALAVFSQSMGAL